MTKLWRSVGYPNRAYNPKTKKFMSVKGLKDNNILTEVENERQNFPERYF
jgi:hypothetical protein